MVDFVDENSEKPDTIDYLHPNGKPVIGPPESKEDARPSVHDLNIALEEADGHYLPRSDPWLDSK